MNIVMHALLIATAAAATPARPTPERIVYETGPCFGFCPAYRVTVSSTGQGVFEGGRFTAVKGRRAFRVTPAQFAAFRAALQPERPIGKRLLGGDAGCQSMATDQITVDVRWIGGAGRPSYLSAYFGCDMDRNAILFRRLRTAPQALPIAGFIGDPHRPK
ncbi:MULTISPECIES: DUF6438 domain-containing protein [unclassified Sphingomonas]|jgi:Domain of unknown function (DUF6438)|uniref:DUF6438 domain-containing protein n=1 Tax=unclassified Sphingomonas TaxID=196159 RepID=UPI000E10170A|nr:MULTISPECIES: DUF6438 domain-containing protein [unclassified Sphingomonas]AXJ94727.1 hypothetical protein DM480_03660 [Sphingomonas sp. FARSPH]